MSQRMHRATRQRSLRRLLIAGSVAFAVAATAVMIGTTLLFGSLQQNLERDTRIRLTEQHAADEIVTSIYGQILASYSQLHAPSTQNVAHFDSLGQRTYERLRLYLFQEMSLDARFQVEAIKELHQTLEVEAHQAFDLARRGEATAARAGVAALEVRAAGLQREVNRFIALREKERNAAHEQHATQWRRMLFGITCVVIVLIVCAILFVGFIQRRIVRPLDQLSAAALRLGAGDLATRIGEQRHLELATVARSFNEMADGIQSARGEIELQNSELNTALSNLKTAQQDLLQQEKLGAIGLMLAGLAHELNNPLAGVLGTAQCLEREMSDHADPAIQLMVQSLVAPLISESRRAGELVRNLLQFSRKSNAEFETVNLKEAIDIAAGLRGYAFAQAMKQLEIDIPSTLFVAAEAQRLEHVAMNIMTNALDALRESHGSRLVIRAERIDAEWISVVFEDDGPGFREPERVFDAFYTTKSVGMGTGLGLTLVHRFVSESGGTITVSNVPSGGARLTIRLRAAAAPSVAVSAATTTMGVRDTAAALPPALTRVETHGSPSASRQPTSGVGNFSHRTILVVDDEPVLREVQRRLLARLGFAVLLAKDGAEAISILEHTPCDAVVTDVRMPGDVDGLGLFEWILQSKPELAERCMFVTGDTQMRAAHPSAAGHPACVVAKPFTVEDYTAGIHALFDAVTAGV